MTNIKLLNPVSPVWRDSISENEYTLDAGAVNPDAIPAPAKKGRRWSWDDFPAENAPAPKRKRAKK